MNCHELRKIIILYLYEELSEKKTLKANRHLEKCANCQLELEKLRETIEIFQQMEVLEPSPSCEEGVRRMAREKLALKPSRLNKAGRFPGRFALRMPRPVTVGLGLLVLLLGLSFYLSQEKIPFPFRGKMPGKIGEMPKWENGTAEEELSLDDTISNLQDEMEMMKWAMPVSDNIFDWEVDNIEKDMSILTSELNSI